MRGQVIESLKGLEICSETWVVLGSFGAEMTHKALSKVAAWSDGVAAGPQPLCGDLECPRLLESLSLATDPRLTPGPMPRLLDQQRWNV